MSFCYFKNPQTPAVIVLALWATKWCIQGQAITKITRLTRQKGVLGKRGDDNANRKRAGSR